MADGAATATVRIPVTAAVLVTLIASGFGVQVTPGGSAVPAQVTLTLPMNPPLGVTVMVEAELVPAVTTTGVEVTVNVPVVLVVTLMDTAVDGPEAT